MHRTPELNGSGGSVCVCVCQSEKHLSFFSPDQLIGNTSGKKVTEGNLKHTPVV